MSRVTDRHKPDDEDASRLKFPQSFGDEDTQRNMLTISEVKLVLESLDNPPDNAVYNKTKDYVDTFARFYDHETASNVRSSFPNPPFQFFEQVQLVNLCPMEAEEAKALVPSIQVEDDQLQQYLDDMTRARKAQQPPA
ncbi:hypothetical protein NBRC10512_000762 [Rhodotorula toruloides]|uniref:RHTO0S04e06128g1_1 n=2 Tax=Rhodotorula toruloides TaxID=5286 RepID=A0A061APT5_RHOTO|nr:DNA-directed RNA polymerase II subunit RPB4 [Rhodotorula toruloides NP11]EMS21150.1 DNA-directed RNA polymerase II subunit RPB4 [Rhodotorula toruloides NP11]KAJ8293859.1 DNA-directed RNA polymerase II subunit RPB4 [Rhodotorula toruloides]CDR39534.1 RHTO0S04e06128g1_1 [Rhodotorula toruloides]